MALQELEKIQNVSISSQIDLWTKQILSTHNISGPKSSTQSHFLFSQLPQDQQHMVSKVIETNLFALMSSSTTETEDLEVEKIEELKCLEVVRQKLGLIFDKKIIEDFEIGDIIEIYDAQGIQVYRNLNFFKMTNYSLLDVITHSWSDLWERSSGVTRQISKMAEVVSTKDDLKPFSCPVEEHYLIEKAYGNTQVIKVKPKKCAKVKLNLKDNFGFMSLIKADVISKDSSNSKVSFI